jgi:surfeit locus 1 family protein
MTDQVTRTRFWPILLASSLALVVLLMLGTWQVQRLAWKQGLIAQLEKSATAEPVDVGQVVDAADYQRVTAKGTFVGAPQFMLSSYQSQPAWLVLAGLQTDADQIVLVDLGHIPEGARASFKLPKGEYQVTGQILRHARAPGLFDLDNNELAATWFWWDVPAMAAAVSSGSAAATPAFVLHVESTSAVPGGPVPQKLASNLRNNHLGYAITWFGLAAVLVVMTGVFVWRRPKAAP